MYSEARCVLHWMIPEWSHIFYQLLVRDDASLFEAIHALLDVHVYPPLVVNQCLEVISVVISCGIILRGIRINSGSGKMLLR